MNKEKGLTFSSLKKGDIFIDTRDSCLYMRITASPFAFGTNSINVHTGELVCFNDNTPVKRYKGTLIFKEEDFEG